MKFVIVSTRQKFGGAIVLHTLCKYLTECGYDASVFYVGENYYSPKKKFRFWIKQTLFMINDLCKAQMVQLRGEKHYFGNPKFNGYVDLSIKGCKQKLWPRADDDTVVIYPDTVHGNFLKAKHVVRWFLYYNRYHDEEAYGKNDLFVAYREIFNDEALNPKKRILNLAHFDLDLYKQSNFGSRKGRCYVIRKGKDRTDLPEHFDGVVVDSLPEREKVKVFNACEYCISYDTQTSYSAIAALCGCISVVVPEQGKTRRDYYFTDEEKYGVALGFSKEELGWSRKTAEKVKTFYENLNRKGISEARKFAVLCREYFSLEDVKEH